MRKNCTILLLCFIVMLSYSCKPDTLGSAELGQYLRDPKNNLIKEIDVDDVKISLMYLPYDLLAAKRKVVSKSSANNISFLISFSANNKELLRQVDMADYSEYVQLFSFGMSEYIVAVTDAGSVVRAKEVVFQNTFGASHANQLLAVFPKGKLLNAKSIIVKVKEFGMGFGDMDFQISTTDVLKTPHLKNLN